MNVKLKTGQVIWLGDNERLVETRACPKCGNQLISHYGCMIQVDFCTSCRYTDVDYSDCFDM